MIVTFVFFNEILAPQFYIFGVTWLLFLSSLCWFSDTTPETECQVYFVYIVVPIHFENFIWTVWPAEGCMDWIIDTHLHLCHILKVHLFTSGCQFIHELRIHKRSF